MSILIDTHVLLWAGGVGHRLSAGAKDLLEDPETAIFFSAASAWEIALKWSKGRLELPTRPAELIDNLIAAGGINKLTISDTDASAVADLPLHHKDPFDRLLVAQARRHGLRLMTANPVLEKYEVDVIALWLDEDDE